MDLSVPRSSPVQLQAHFPSYDTHSPYKDVFLNKRRYTTTAA